MDQNQINIFFKRFNKNFPQKQYWIKMLRINTFEQINALFSNQPNKSFKSLKQKMNEKTTIKVLVKHLEKRLEIGEYKDSVHKIKLITTLQMIQEMISE